MIKANELRLGNIIEYPEYSASLTIEQIDKLNVNIVYKLKDCKPIPITEELLIKFGCVKLNNSMFRFGKFTFQGTSTDDGGDLHNKIITSRKAIKVCFEGKYFRTIEYIHSLQNLYFALTNEELTIKENDI